MADSGKKRKKGTGFIFAAVKINPVPFHAVKAI
jgi:hypothetical protein